MLKRLEHWATRAYHDFLVSRASVPFAWGLNDCALFAADGIQAITGVDIAGEFRGKYSTRDEAFALIKAIAGGKTVADAAAHCAALHGLVEWRYPLCAQRGDLVVFEDEGGNLISGLVALTGRHIVSPHDKGLMQFPITAAKRAWHV